MANTTCRLAAAALVFACAFAGAIECPFAAIAQADEQTKFAPLDLPQRDFEQFHQLIKPIPGEMGWRNDIPWLTDLGQARAKAAAEDKPILIWISADGHPLGAT